MKPASDQRDKQVSVGLELPLLSLVAERIGQRHADTFCGMRMVVSQHLLSTIVPLFERLWEQGADPKQMTIIGKIYSTSPEVVRYLEAKGCCVIVAEAGAPGRYDEQLRAAAALYWGSSLQKSAVGERYLLIDHGGFLRATIPEGFSSKNQVVAVEHTTKGIFSSAKNVVPTINMAQSRVKKELEAPIIVDQVIRRLRAQNLLDLKTAIGIVGTGSIGRVLAGALRQSGYSVLTYDPQVISLAGSSPAAECIDFCSSIQELVSQTTLIIGCSGRDSLADVDWTSISGSKVLVSTSSSDVEFSSLLKLSQVPAHDPRADTFRKIGGCSFRIVYGGFPINFDPAGEPDLAIDLTRALTYLSACQAAELLHRDLLISLQVEFEDMLEEQGRRVCFS